ncbi:MAG: RiPP maturation radical SAM C-methyltransferase [Pseudomonadota bacterium]
MIHLVNMPFGSVTHAAIGPALLKAILARAGQSARVFNFNLRFARMIGPGAYERIAFFRGAETQISEWLFAREAWDIPVGPPEDDFIAACQRELGAIPKVPDLGAWLRLVRHEVVPQFLAGCADSLARAALPVVVGFSCSFFQTLSSLALARRLKETHPGVRIAFGGPGFHGPLGEELFARLPWIDAVSTGEADDVVAPLFAALAEGRPPRGLHGVLYREPGGRAQAGPSARPVTAEVLSDLPVPDFDDLFADAREVGLLGEPSWRARLVLPFESSRGCWWGARHHCTFCGLNGRGMGYRARDPDRVYDQLQKYTQRYPRAVLQASDNNLSPDYFRTLLPRLAAEPLPSTPPLYYGVKASLGRRQLAALAAANVRFLQPGIENLSTRLLGLMRKGTTGLQNVRFLRLCREYGLTPFWNHLVRIPGEAAEDYAEIVRWVRRIPHLRPPYGGALMIECHRYSPYFEEPGRWVSSVRPQAWYGALFPPERCDISRLAYYFDAEWQDTLDPSAYREVADAIHGWLHTWWHAGALPQLALRVLEDGTAEVLDTRAGEQRRWSLTPAEHAALDAVDDIGDLEAVSARLGGVDTAALGVTLAALVKRGLALEEGGSYLGIVLPADAPEPPLAARRGTLQAQA